MALLQKINIDDVIIYDKELLPNGYNIGNLLNIPYLLDLWKQIPHNSITQYNNMIDKSKTWPQSIVGLYCKDRPENENIPNINRLVKSVNLYIEQNYNNFDMIDLVKDKDTLCIHIRSGDIGVISNNFITNIKKLIVNYKKIILFGGVHLDSRYGTEKQNKIATANYVNNHMGLPIGNGLLFYMMHLLPIIGWITAPFYALIAAQLNTQELKDKEVEKANTTHRARTRGWGEPPQKPSNSNSK